MSKRTPPIVPASTKIAPAGTVFIATLHPGEVKTEFYRSVATLCLHNPYGAIRGIHTTKTARSWLGRNQAIEEFLKSPADWLLWIDSDMVFSPATFITLYEEAMKNPETKIISALAFIWDDANTAILPNIFNWSEELGHYDLEWRYEPNTRFWCDATGVAFTLIHREVFEKVGYPYHQEWVIHPDTDHPMGHDISFYHEARKHGYRVRYCADAKTEHIKHWAVSEHGFNQQLALIAAQEEQEQNEQA